LGKIKVKKAAGEIKRVKEPDPPYTINEKERGGDEKAKVPKEGAVVLKKKKNIVTKRHLQGEKGRSRERKKGRHGDPKKKNAGKGFQSPKQKRGEKQGPWRDAAIGIERGQIRKRVLGCVSNLLKEKKRTVGEEESQYHQNKGAT